VREVGFAPTVAQVERGGREQDQIHQRTQTNSAAPEPRTAQQVRAARPASSTTQKPTSQATITA
jgi:hypothetical protein